MTEPEPTIREQMDEMLWRERTPAELISELGNTYSEALPLRIHILLSQATKLLLEQAEMSATIAACVRQSCTLDSAVMQKGGDHIVYGVADWIENPPEWVKAPWAAPKETR